MATDMLKIFSYNIIVLRAHYGYSQKRMAQLLGIGVGSLCKIERGIIPPRLTVDIIFAVQKHFHISPDTLFSEELSLLIGEEQ